MTKDCKHIFLAEDSMADVRLIEEALRRKSVDYRLEHYTTAEEAIEAASRSGSEDHPVPDLILLDYNLPRGHGCDILAAAAANPKLAAVPKAIVSSFLRPDEKERAMTLGASCFIAKPATLGEFLRDVGTRVTELLQIEKTGSF